MIVVLDVMYVKSCRPKKLRLHNNKFAKNSDASIGLDLTINVDCGLKLFETNIFKVDKTK